MMRKTALWVVLLAMAITPAAIATTTLSLEGAYVEARSAQVFIGGCVWNSEAVTIGREAIMAWRIEKGQIDGIDVTGLSVVAAIAGEANLAMEPDAPRRTMSELRDGVYGDDARLLVDFEVRDSSGRLVCRQSDYRYENVPLPFGGRLAARRAQHGTPARSPWY